MLRCRLKVFDAAIVCLTILNLATVAHGVRETNFRDLGDTDTGQNVATEAAASQKLALEHARKEDAELNRRAVLLKVFGITAKPRSLSQLTVFKSSVKVKENWLSIEKSMTKIRDLGPDAVFGAVLIILFIVGCLKLFTEGGKEVNENAGLEFVDPRILPALALWLSFWLLPSCQHLNGTEFHQMLSMIGASLTLNGTVYIVGTFIKRWWLSYLGFTADEVSAFCGVGELDLQDLFEKYGIKQIRTCDAITRKGKHMLKHIGTMVMWTVLYRGYQGVVFSRTVEMLYGWILIKSGGCLAMLLYGGSARVLDGKWRRWNVVNTLAATILSLFTSWFICYLPIWIRIPGGRPGTLMMLLTEGPQAIGDAFAELVGGSVGGTIWNRFKVPTGGIGEVNEKSWEGCWGMFLSSWITGIICVQQYDGLNAEAKFAWHVVCFWVCALCTVLETLSPRGTDNLTMPIGSWAVIWVALNWGYLSWEDAAL